MLCIGKENKHCGAVWKAFLVLRFDAKMIPFRAVILQRILPLCCPALFAVRFESPVAFRFAHCFILQLPKIAEDEAMAMMMSRVVILSKFKMFAVFDDCGCEGEIAFGHLLHLVYEDGAAGEDDFVFAVVFYL